MILYAGRITLIKKENGHVYFVFEKAEDYYKTCRLARKKYKIKTKRRRIVRKYFKKLVNEALRDAIKDLYESET